MLQLDKQYPQYGFAQHKGYGVVAHMAAVRQHGPCPEHRRSFEPVKSMVGYVKPGGKTK
jgi:ribonuclease HII